MISCTIKSQCCSRAAAPGLADARRKLKRYESSIRSSIYKALFIVCGFCSAWSESALSCDLYIKPINVKVLKEKVLCISNGGCIQEVTVELDQKKLVITTNKKPWVTTGEVVEIVKISGVYFPSRPRGSGQSYFYKLYRYCEVLE
jgi:hypothetical protein